MFDPSTIKSERLKRLYAYWDAKRAGRRMPSRKDIDPLDIPWALGDVSLIDVLAEGGFHWRLDGTNLGTFFGCDMTGRNLSEYPYPQFIDTMRRTMLPPVETREPFHQTRHYSKDTRRWNYDSILLPLSDDGERVDMLIQMLHIMRT